MRILYPILIMLLAVGCSDSSSSTPRDEAGSSDVTSVELPPGKPLTVSLQGTWQVFNLPIDWIGEHLKREPPGRAYVALAPPHVDDLQADYAPCDPPSRIILGIVGQAGTVREHLATCLEYCSDHDTPESMHRGLWGSLTHLVGITVQLGEDGTIDVMEHYRKGLSI